MKHHWHSLGLEKTPGTLKKKGLTDTHTTTHTEWQHHFLIRSSQLKICLNIAVLIGNIIIFLYLFLTQCFMDIIFIPRSSVTQTNSQYWPTRQMGIDSRILPAHCIFITSFCQLQGWNYIFCYWVPKLFRIHSGKNIVSKMICMSLQKWNFCQSATRMFQEEIW